MPCSKRKSGIWSISIKTPAIKDIIADGSDWKYKKTPPLTVKDAAICKTGLMIAPFYRSKME